MKRTISFREFIEILNKNGYQRVRITGSHYIYKKDIHTISVNRNLNRMVAKRLIKENKLII